MAERNPQAEMPFLEHLEELRWRILYSLVAVTLGTVVGWVVVSHFDVLELLKRPIAPYLPGGKLTFTSPTEPFMLTLKLAFATGVVLASPVVIYQVWAFLAPALYPREKRLILPALSIGVVLAQNPPPARGLSSRCSHLFRSAGLNLSRPITPSLHQTVCTVSSSGTPSTTIRIEGAYATG